MTHGLPEHHGGELSHCAPRTPPMLPSPGVMDDGCECEPSLPCQCDEPPLHRRERKPELQDSMMGQSSMVIAVENEPPLTHRRRHDLDGTQQTLKAVGESSIADQDPQQGVGSSMLLQLPLPSCIDGPVTSLASECPVVDASGDAPRLPYIMDAPPSESGLAQQVAAAERVQAPLSLNEPACVIHVDFLGRRRRYFSRAECAKHNTREDCWLISHGKVYAVTAFLSRHPAGEYAILRHGGTDSSTDFDFHSPKAQRMWAPFVIGYAEPLAGAAGSSDCVVS